MEPPNLRRVRAPIAALEYDRTKTKTKKRKIKKKGALRGNIDIAEGAETRRREGETKEREKKQ